jgi:hypothetical protein
MHFHVFTFMCLFHVAMFSVLDVKNVVVGKLLEMSMSFIVSALSVATSGEFH